MRIAIDIRPALRRGTGVGTFVEQIVLALDALPGGHELRLFTSSWKDRWPSDRLAGLGKAVVVDRRWPVKLLNLLWHRLGWPQVERFVGPVDIAHSPTPLMLPSRAPRIVTLHDLYFLRHPESLHAEIRRDYGRLVRRHVNKADAVLSVSEATALDAVELLGLPRERLTVCWEDAAPIYDERPGEAELEASKQIADEPFLLFVGTIEPRKNLVALLDAFTLLQPRHPELKLVLAGERGWGCETFDQALAGMQHPERVVITGYLDQVSLRSLYHRAIALVMPSHCEGFGLPLVEAMACGCPLVVSDNGSLPEIAGDAALIWRSGEPENLAQLLGEVVDDEDCRSGLVERGRERRSKFNWSESARRILKLYQDLVGG